MRPASDFIYIQLSNSREKEIKKKQSEKLSVYCAGSFFYAGLGIAFPL